MVALSEQQEAIIRRLGDGWQVTAQDGERPATFYLTKANINTRWALYPQTRHSLVRRGILAQEPGKLRWALTDYGHTVARALREKARREAHADLP
jgi:hypothetical protein